MKLEIGQQIATNYGTGPYEITGIKRECICPLPLDQIEYGFEEAPESAPHIHIVCRGTDGREAYLGWYNEETLTDIAGRSDKIILLQNTKLIQMSLI